jgi:hypothetical protein
MFMNLCDILYGRYLPKQQKNHVRRLMMKKMEFIRIATIACLALAGTARAEQPFDDGAFELQEQQTASTADTPTTQQLALADTDTDQTLQQLALSDPDDAKAPQQQTIASDDGFQVPQQQGIVQTTSAPPQPSLASAEPQQVPQKQRLSRKEVVAIANASDPAKQQTADAITAVLHGKNPETVNRDINQAGNTIEPDKNKAAAIDAPKITAADTVNSGAPADLTDMKHFIIRSKGDVAYSMDCYIKAKDVLCKGSLKKQPANFKSYESTLIGQISGSVIKGNVTSYTKIAGSSAGKDCDTDNETSWPMTITLNADHEALMDTGPIKSFINTTGSANCTGTSEQSYPGKKISMKWRAIG